MQQGGSGGGGGGGASSHYGVSPEMAQFATKSTGGRTNMVGISSSETALEEAASPISSRPPPQRGGFEELVPVVGGLQEEEALAVEEAERGTSGNRWPRQETVALLKIRSEIDAAFRDATLKGPLWEDVSRKLAELGYQRSAKKCKEKFENVHKYYKRTKEGRAGRQDGKSYRFFTQLEAFHAATANATTFAVASSSTPPAAALAATPISVGVANPAVTASTSARPLPVSSTPPAPIAMPDVTAVGINFSSNSEEEEEEGGEETGRKRKRSGGRSGMGKKMKGFFEGVMRQVMERQEAMQQRFLEAIEKREQDRMIREEAWRRQEMARLSREHELLAQERAMAASRDAAVIAFLQKFTGQTIQLPPAVSIPAAPPPPPQPVHSHHHQQQISPLQIRTPEVTRRHQTAPSSVEVLTIEQNQEIAATTPTTAGGSDATSSRWPKAEVLSLIKLRSGLELKYQEAGPKGPLWEEISAGMQRLGYKRSSKRCKEKWENINKYFKKVKESNKKRPEDAKTCPYFHELDALYRKKTLGGSSGGGGVVSSSSATAQQKQEQELIQNPISTLPKERSDVGGQSQPQAEPKNGNSGNDSGSNDGSGGGGGCSSTQVPTNNGGDVSPSFLGDEASTKKPEDIVKELMAGHQRQHRTAIDEYDKLEDPNCSEAEEIDEEDEEDDELESGNMAYEIQFQRPNANSSNAGSSNVATAAAGAADSFLTMVQ